MNNEEKITFVDEIKCKFCIEENRKLQYGETVEIVPFLIFNTMPIPDFIKSKSFKICQGHLNYVCYPYTIIGFQGKEMNLGYTPTWKTEFTLKGNKYEKEREVEVMKILKPEIWKDFNRYIKTYVKIIQENEGGKNEQRI